MKTMIDATSPISILAAGLILGLSHAMEADHIAAVSTIITQRNKFKDFIKLGISWGLGHTLAIGIIGILILAFKLQLPANFAVILETIVGGMLVVLGIRLAFKIKKDKIHIHVHDHNKSAHLHPHSHLKSSSHSHIHRSFFIGLIHGLAGSAAIILLVLTTIDEIKTGILYLLLFGVGSIVGMAILSSLIGLPLKLLTKSQKATNGIQYLAAGISLFIGLRIISEQIPLL